MEGYGDDFEEVYNIGKEQLENNLYSSNVSDVVIK